MGPDRFSLTLAWVCLQGFTSTGSKADLPTGSCQNPNQSRVDRDCPSSTSSISLCAWCCVPPFRKTIEARLEPIPEQSRRAILFPKMTSHKTVLSHWVCRERGIFVDVSCSRQSTAALSTTLEGAFAVKTAPNDATRWIRAWSGTQCVSQGV